jgi:hypothetical protein
LWFWHCERRGRRCGSSVRPRAYRLQRRAGAVDHDNVPGCRRSRYRLALWGYFSQGKTTGQKNLKHIPTDLTRAPAAGKAVSVCAVPRLWDSRSNHSPGPGSLRPEAIGAAMEVTKSTKPSRQRAAWRPGDQAGRSASERRAGLEKINVGADPALARETSVKSVFSERSWSSYAAHGQSVADARLSRIPESEPLGRTSSSRRGAWSRPVSTAQRAGELERVRASVRTGKPLGDDAWVTAKARTLGLDVNPRPRGRPRTTKKKHRISPCREAQDVQELLPPRIERPIRMVPDQPSLTD